MSDLVLRCACGELEGAVREVSPGVGNHCVCYCDDCQSFAWYLGRAQQVLDAHGGTGIFQTSPARVEIGRGREHLACMRLTEKGVLRWYADCCKTPLGNTLATPALPFVGLVTACLEPASDARLEDALGPVRARVHARFARGERATLRDAHDRAPAGMLLRFAGLMLRARLRGDHRRSLFFDASSGEPSVTPRVLDDAERAAVARARDAA